LQHVAVGVVSDREEMRRHLGSPFALVLLDDTQRVDGNASIWVDNHAEQTRVRLQSHRMCLSNRTHCTRVGSSLSSSARVNQRRHSRKWY